MGSVKGEAVLNILENCFLIGVWAYTVHTTFSMCLCGFVTTSLIIFIRVTSFWLWSYHTINPGPVGQKIRIYTNKQCKSTGSYWHFIQIWVKWSCLLLQYIPWVKCLFKKDMYISWFFVLLLRICHLFRNFCSIAMLFWWYIFIYQCAIGSITWELVNAWECLYNKCP